MKKLIKSLFFIIFLGSSLFAMKNFSFFNKDKYFINSELKTLIRNYRASLSMYTLSGSLFEKIKKNIEKLSQFTEDYAKKESDKIDEKLLKDLKITINYLDKELGFND